MNETIKHIANQAGFTLNQIDDESIKLETFAKLIIKECVKECVKSIEQHEIPVGNSAAGELACEWTYNALKEIRNEIKEKFDVK
jgi:hypothetical protein